MLILILVELLIILPVVAAFLCSIVDKKKRSGKAYLVTQKEIERDKSQFMLINQGHSLDDYKIYKIPYHCIGYSED